MRDLALRTLLLAVTLAPFAGCDTAANPDLKNLPPGSVGGFSDDGSAGPRRVGDGGAGQLRITILSPMANQILPASSAPEVRATVTSVVPGTNDPSMDPVDSTSLLATLHAVGNNEVLANGKLFGPMADDQFAGRLDLGRASTGDYLLTVSALTAAGTRSSSTISVRIDAGPRITIVSPRPLGSYKGSLMVQVIIESAPFPPTSGIEATIGNAPVMLQPSGAPNTYEALVEFLKFQPPLDGEQVLKVVANNAQGTRAEAKVRFLIDNAGPEFTLTEPPPDSVVGGIIRVRAKVRDPAGVLGNSVIAVIGNKTDVNFKLELKPEGDTGVFSEVFDTRRLTSCGRLPDPKLCIVFPNLSFRASDVLGNEAVNAYDIGVDNQPPVLDLNPPHVRLIKWDGNVRRNVCSWEFDPVGDYLGIGDMPNDGCGVPQVFDLRARIEDDGNRADGLKWAPISGIDPATTALFVLDDTTQPLVVDVDGDGVCDQINPKLVPTTTPPTQSNQVLEVRLSGVPPKGTGDFTPDPSLNSPQAAIDYPGCSIGADPKAPGPLCVRQMLTVAIGYPVASGPDPAIWAIEPITEAEPWCVGSQFDTFANQISEGWACIAAQSSDLLGNQSVSAPLRVWIKWRGLGNSIIGVCPNPPADAGPPPNCSGSYSRSAGQVSSTPCVGRGFGGGRPQVLGAGGKAESTK